MAIFVAESDSCKRNTYLRVLQKLKISLSIKSTIMSIIYPKTRKGNHTDNYFGTTVPDPYRWLEDDFSEETKAWVDAQNEVTNAHLETIPFKGDIRKRLEELWSHERYSCPSKKGDFYFYFFNNGLQNQDVLYMTRDVRKAGKTVLDPNTLSDDGTTALSVISVSDDARYIAYSVSKSGSDWNEIFVKDIQSNSLLQDHIQWVKFSGIEWFAGGFYYARYPKPEDNNRLMGENKHCRVYYHALGTRQQEDLLILENPNKPEWGFTPKVIQHKWLAIYTTESTSGNGLMVRDLHEKNSQWKSISETFEQDFHVVGCHQNQIIIWTNWNAPTYQIISIDLQQPQKENWKIIIPPTTDTLVEGKFMGGKLILNYLHNASSVIKVFGLDGTFEYDLNLPGIGTVNGLESDVDNTQTFFSYSSFSVPETIFKWDVQKNISSCWKTTNIDFKHNDYSTKQVVYPSNDGTEISMFITHKKDLKLDGNRPALLYGYGGFNISLTPEFNKTRLIWLENDGILAVPNLRGGGEYGERWHKQGTLFEKQNVFDDFIAAAEYLINKSYTKKERLTIHGGSNGGLLVGAVSNERPDLFAVAIPSVGVMDMLRYHRFTIGRYWASDYGNSGESKKMFEYLLQYSPVHNVKDKTPYPAIMVTTADHDDRVVPAHSFKYIAQLQEKQYGRNPRLIRIEKNAGHGAGKPTDKILDFYSDLWAFAFFHMNVVPNY